ncbi:bidirectional sugar transporter SWEET16-like [Cornus florida]|uniref:bidirectional sugar transporter SWEET16-like n=1 Tax=Cornus florida TaxID=4283 RepID=UPI00289E1661|nr:bidirectional sugar transporter SWEET16-like [Cornus florida]
MANVSFYIGIVGNVISLLVFLSPIGTFKTVVKKKSTLNYKGLPYISTLLSTTLWCFYGVLNPDGLLVLTINGAGATLQLIYVILFLIYAPKEIKVKHMKLVAILNVGFFGTVIAVAYIAIDESFRLTFAGILCAGFTIGMYASPLSVMRTVIKTKSVEYMPFFLSFFLFINAGVWSTYAVLVKDYYILVPNSIGFVLGTAQLVIYGMYKKSSDALKKKAIEMESFDEEAQKNPSLNKGNSLPKPSLSRQYSVQKVIKTHSLDHPQSQKKFKTVDLF